MKSKAHFRSHPIHPILIVFPIAFFTGAFLFDILKSITDNVSFETTSGYLILAGIISGFIAAIPGIIDYFFTVPPKSSAKKRATQHGLINVSMLIIFIIVFALRQKSGVPAWPVIGLEFIGIVLMTISGWIGGTLVHRNQVGVDIRYAGAGKWKEEFITVSDGKMQVAAADELKLNQMKLIHVNKKRIVIGKTENGYVAFDDRCTHRGGTLAGGAMICSTVQCPWHGSQFDVSTGEVKAGPAKEKINVHKIIEENGKIFLRM
jgi:uncharacterized membrane protein/nitrite reductase/ring-hydroxylating ferredoxin subunit